MQRMLVFLTVTLSLAGAAAARQQRDTPARQATGRVHGQVVAAETGRPVAHAVISAAKTDAPPGQLTDRVVADEQGLFEFEALATGTYEFTATKPGLFLDTQQGQTHADLPGSAVAVGTGRETALEFRLMRAGVISGRVLDANGDPVALADVALVGRDGNLRGSRVGFGA